MAIKSKMSAVSLYLSLSLSLSLSAQLVATNDRHGQNILKTFPEETRLFFIKFIHPLSASEFETIAFVKNSSVESRIEEN
jgi:hypothetical protein